MLDDAVVPALSWVILGHCPSSRHPHVGSFSDGSSHTRMSPGRLQSEVKKTIADCIYSDAGICANYAFGCNLNFSVLRMHAQRDIVLQQREAAAMGVIGETNAYVAVKILQNLLRRHWSSKITSYCTVQENGLPAR